MAQATSGIRAALSQPAVYEARISGLRALKAGLRGSQPTPSSRCQACVLSTSVAGQR